MSRHLYFGGCVFAVLVLLVPVVWLSVNATLRRGDLALLFFPWLVCVFFIALLFKAWKEIYR